MSLCHFTLKGKRTRLNVERIGAAFTVFDSVEYFRAAFSDVPFKVAARQTIDMTNIATLVATPTSGTTFGTLNP